MSVAQGAELKSGLTFGGKNPDSIKAVPHCEESPFFGQISDGNHHSQPKCKWRLKKLLYKKPYGKLLSWKSKKMRRSLEGLTNKEITEIYAKLKLEDRQQFRQFKRFDKTYYELHGHDAPSHQLAQGIIREMFSGLLARGRRNYCEHEGGTVSCTEAKRFMQKVRTGRTSQATKLLTATSTGVSTATTSIMASLLTT